MITPAEALQRWLIAFAFGCGLGVYYGFLRPLRPRHTHLSDFLFLIGAFWAWLQVSFGVCQGDIRLSESVGMLCGGLCWELTIGRLLRPVFYKFWWLIGKIFHISLLPFRFFLKKAKKYLNFLLLSAKKASTMDKRKKRNGGGHHSRQESFQADPAGISAQ